MPLEVALVNVHPSCWCPLFRKISFFYNFSEIVLTKLGVPGGEWQGEIKRGVTSFVLCFFLIFFRGEEKRGEEGEERGGENECKNCT